MSGLPDAVVELVGGSEGLVVPRHGMQRRCRHGVPVEVAAMGVLASTLIAEVHGST